MTDAGPRAHTPGARPAHLLAGALAAGLASAALGRWVLLGAAVATVLAAGPRAAPATLVLALALLAAGLCAGTLRLEALAPAPVRPAALADAAVTLETPPRATAFGWHAEARMGPARVLLQGRGAPSPVAAAGDVARVSGRVRGLLPREGWLRDRHVGAVVRVTRLRATGRRRAGLAGAIDAARRRATRAMAAPAPRDRALLVGMTLGDDSGLSPGDREAMRRSGLGHLVAASGANVALLATFALAVGAAFGVPLALRLVTVLVLIALYVPLAGGGPSIQRAGVMGAASVVAALASRPASRVHALLLAAAGTLLLDPAAVRLPAWQLSFAAVVAIALLCAPIRARLTARGVPRVLAEAAALTTAAGLGTAPVAAATFGDVPLYSLPANLLVAPLVAPVTWLGMAAALLGQVDAGLGAAPALAAAPGLALIRWTAHLSSAAPGAVVAPGVLPVALLCAAAGAAIALPRARLPVAGTLLGCALAALLLPALLRPRPPAPPAADALRVSFLDIGQGDATLLQAGRHAVLVDAGPPGGPVLRRLGSEGVRALDLLVATHAQADHLGASAAVLRAMPVGAVLDGRDGVREAWGSAMAARARERRVPLMAPHAGSELRVGALRLRVLWPPRADGPPAAGEDPNDRAIVLLAEAAGVRVLLTADAESPVLARLALPPVDVLKVSHHGSEDDGLPALLQRLRPRLAVIEVGDGNTYGHPTPQTLRALSLAGVRTLRTDRDGTVRVDAAGGRLRVQAGA